MSKKLILHDFVVPFERNVKTHCQLCNQSFSVIKRQHICKRCYRSVCDICSPFKVKIYTLDFKNKLHRMCRTCHIQSEVLHKYSKSNHLKFGEDSDVVKMWLKQLGLKHVPKRRISQKKKTIEYTSFMEIWKSLNFSFRELVGIAIDEAKISQKQLINLINSALTQLDQNNYDLNHLVYIVLFFLTHTSITNCVYFTSVIMQVLSSQSEPKVQNISFFLRELHCSDIEAFKMENLLEEILDKMIKRATVNVFTAEVTIQIINNIVSKRDFQELEKGIAYVFCKRKQFICMNPNKPENVYLDILRNLDSSDYKKGIKGLQSCPSEKSQRSSPNRSQKSIKLQPSKKPIESSPKYQQLLRQNNQLKEIIKAQEQKLNSLTKQCEQQRSSQSSLKVYPIHKKQMNESVRNSYEDGFWRESSDCSDFKDQYSTDPSGDQSAYNSILTKKNEEIARMKNQVASLNKTLKEYQESPHLKQEQNLSSSSKPLGSSSAGFSKQVKQKQEQIAQLKVQNDGLKNINKRLLMKMHELSNLLMDKQEKSINDSNHNLEELTEKYSKISDEQMKQQCTIF